LHGHYPIEESTMKARALALGLLLIVIVPPDSLATEIAPATPQSVADELLDTDRRFSEASAKTDVVDGLSAQFADDVVMTMPGKGLLRSRAAVIEGLRANADNLTAKIAWTPAGVGISGDGLHGFTFGTMVQRKPDGSNTPLKYLAYWVRVPEGWRVIAYKRKARAEGSSDVAMLPARLPAKLVAVSADDGGQLGFAEKLALAERAFSDEAQHAGLGPAFLKYGSAESISLGGGADAGFIVGAQAIAESVSAGQPPSGSTVAWAPDQVVVARSNDLGVTIGTMRFNQPPTNGKPPATVPFFTVWRRATPNSPWRYVAE